MNERIPEEKQWRKKKREKRKNQYSRPKSAFTKHFLEKPNPSTEILEDTDNIKTAFKDGKTPIF